MTKEEAIMKIHAEAACKVPRSPQFMADFAEVMIRHIDGVQEGGQKNDHRQSAGDRILLHVSG